MRKSNKASQTAAPTMETVERPAHIDNGDAARSGATERSNQTSTQPEPSAGMAIADSALENVLPFIGTPNRKPDALDAIAATIADNIRAKVETMGTARQRLAEAYDLFKEGGDNETKAMEIANGAMSSLYQGRVNGYVTNEEVSAALGDVFGYKAKADGKPGRTPDGKGEHIRKRIVRAVQAFEYVNNPDGGSKFFDGMNRQKVATILNNVSNGDMTLNTAYERFADVKKEESEGPVSPAFNARTLAKIIDGLNELNAAEIIGADIGLQTVYVELRGAISHMAERLPKAA